jgi:CRP-like cAMP-binding protein
MGLRSRVAVAINQQYLREMPFFLGADVNLTMELALVMESVFFSADECVMKEGDEGEEMYFIVAGTVEVVVNVKVGAKAQEGEQGLDEHRVAVLIEKQ